MLRLSPVQHKSAGLRSCCADDAVAVSSSGCFRCRGPLRPVDIGDDGHGLQRERLCAAGWDRAHPSFSAEKLERSLTRSVTSVGRGARRVQRPCPCPLVLESAQRSLPSRRVVVRKDVTERTETVRDDVRREEVDVQDANPKFSLAITAMPSLLNHSGQKAFSKSVHVALHRRVAL